MAKDYAKRFYTSEQWAAVRAAYLTRVFNQCERCGAPAKIVHHKKYITADNIKDPKITLDFKNLEALCQDCHNKQHITGAFRTRRYRIGKNGEVIPPYQKN